MKYVIAVCAGLSVILLACSNEPGRPTDVDERVYTVKLVFFDFYDRDVRLSINGVEIINEHLDVDEFHATNGLNFVKNQDLKHKNVFQLKTKDLNIETVITVNANTKLIYINPSDQPYIEASESDVIALD